MTTVKIYDGSNNIWIFQDYENIKRGDIFKLFKPDGHPVVSCSGCTVFEASSDAYLNEEDIWQVNISDTLAQSN